MYHHLCGITQSIFCFYSLKQVNHTCWLCFMGRFHVSLLPPRGSKPCGPHEKERQDVTLPCASGLPHISLACPDGGISPGGRAADVQVKTRLHNGKTPILRIMLSFFPCMIPGVQNRTQLVINKSVTRSHSRKDKCPRMHRYLPEDAVSLLERGWFSRTYRRDTDLLHGGFIKCSKTTRS